MNCDELINEVGKRIKILREKNDETQEALGKAIGISQDAVSKIETGKTQLTLENQLRIAEHFNVSHDYLCKGVDSNSILNLLEKYVHMKIASASVGMETYKYPVLKIDKNFYRYLTQTVRAENTYNIPEEIRTKWMEYEIQAFYESNGTDKEVEIVVPLPEKLIFPDEQKGDWTQSDLLRAITNDWFNTKGSI